MYMLSEFVRPALHELGDLRPWCRPRRARGLVAENARAILQDRQGRLWIGTRGGLTSVQEDLHGDLWIRTEGSGLFRLADGGLQSYTASLPDNFVRDMILDSQGALWIGTNAGLARHQDGVFTTFTQADRLADDIVMALHKDPEGSLWIGTYNGGLSRLKDGVARRIRCSVSWTSFWSFRRSPRSPERRKRFRREGGRGHLQFYRARSNRVTFLTQAIE